MIVRTDLTDVTLMSDDTYGDDEEDEEGEEGEEGGEGEDIFDEEVRIVKEAIRSDGL